MCCVPREEGDRSRQDAYVVWVLFREGMIEGIVVIFVSIF